MNRSTRRTAVGFVVAPLVGISAWGILMSFIGPAPLESLQQLPALTIFASIYSYPAVLVLGVPAFMLYRRLQIDSLRSYALGGFAGGTLLGAVVFGFADSHPTMDPRLSSVLFWCTMGLGGAAGAAFFWAFVIRDKRRAA